LAARFSFSVLGSEAKDALYYAESCGNDEIKAMIARAVQDRASTSSKPSETGR